MFSSPNHIGSVKNPPTDSHSQPTQMLRASGFFGFFSFLSFVQIVDTAKGMFDLMERECTFVETQDAAPLSLASVGGVTVFL